MRGGEVEEVMGTRGGSMRREIRGDEDKVGRSRGSECN